MKRIVIIEGNVRGIAAESPSQDVLTIDINDVDTDTYSVPPAVGEFIAREAYRGRIRIVVECGAEESPKVIPIGGAENASTEALLRDLASARNSNIEYQREIAAARHAADEYRRENEAIVNSKDRLRTDIHASRPVAFDPEKHITKATVCGWLERDADLSAQASKCVGTDDRTARRAYSACSDSTRDIIRRINATKETL